MIMLERDGGMLLVDALVGMPFAPSERETRIQAGPRGLGVAIGLGVDDLAAAYRWCRDNGFEITSEPRREAFGDDIFECVDPDGYLWEISQPAADAVIQDPATATRDAWFGNS